MSSSQAARDELRRSFDDLAMVADDAWSCNRHYYPFILGQLPARMDSVLDVGCGTGGLTRLLAARSRRVLGVDLSPEMVRVARLRSADHANIDYEVEDVTAWRLPQEAFDAVVSVAVLHHLPGEHFLARATKALRPGGVLVVMDILRAGGPRDWLLGGLAYLAAGGHRLVATGKLRSPRREREAWSRHARQDHLPTMDEAQVLRRGVLSDAVIRRHLLWRYSLVWRKPMGAPPR